MTNFESSFLIWESKEIGIEGTGFRINFPKGESFAERRWGMFLSWMVRTFFNSVEDKWRGCSFFLEIFPMQQKALLLRERMEGLSLDVLDRSQRWCFRKGLFGMTDFESSFLIWESKETGIEGSGFRINFPEGESFAERRWGMFLSWMVRTFLNSVEDKWKRFSFKKGICKNNLKG
ncbi:MAG: hypothetical protein AB7E52_07915 [Bdellovibrionales bacterium]